MIARFSLYDFIAAVIPGILFIWVISTISNVVGITFSIPLTGELAETSVLIALAYVTGLLLQGISQGLTEKILLKIWGGFPSARWLLPDDSRLSKDYKNKIRQIVKERYGIESENTLSIKEQLKKNQGIFYLCYNAVDKENLSDRPQIFNAHYGLFRCLLTTFSILFCLNLFVLIFNKSIEHNIIYGFLIFALIGAIVSYFRTKKRSEDFAKSIYDLFLVKFSE